MVRRLFLYTVVLACLSPALFIQMQAQEPLDGPKRVFRDELLDNLVGDWKLTRRIRGQSDESTVKAEWVLNHQFLLVRMKGVKNPLSYEAIVFIGYDNTSERYVAHWLDVGGGRYSESLGYGARTGNSIRFVFEYPDGPFLNTFTWNAETRSWSSLMQNKDAAGRWVPFAEDSLRRS